MSNSWLETTRGLKSPDDIRVNPPSFNVNDKKPAERFPEPNIWCDEEDCSYDELCDEVSWYHPHSSLMWRHENQSILRSKRYYVSAYVDHKESENKSYRAESILASSRQSAWWIFDHCLCSLLDYRILGDVSVIQLGPASIQVDGFWENDDWDKIDQIVCAEIEI